MTLPVSFEANSSRLGFVKADVFALCFFVGSAAAPPVDLVLLLLGTFFFGFLPRPTPGISKF